MSEASNIWILGAGPVGVVLANLINSHQPRLVVRSRRDIHLEKNNQIFELSTSQVLSSEFTNELKNHPPGHKGYIFLTLKTYDLFASETSEWFAQAKSNPNISFILCSNGLGVYDEFIRRFEIAPERVARMTVWFGAFSEKQGVQQIVHLRGMRGLEAFAPTSEFQKKLETILLPVFFKSVEELEWRKLIINVLNVIPALFNEKNKIYLDNPAAKKLALSLLEESISIAHKVGISLEMTPEGILENSRVVAENYSSTVQDMKARKPTEIEWINEAIVRKASTIGVKATINETLSLLLRSRISH